MLCHNCSRGMIYCGECDGKEYERHEKHRKEARMPKYPFTIYFPDFFREPITKTYSAATAGKAKYLCYLHFRDAYDMSFGEFLKVIRVWKLKDIETNE